MVVKANLLKIQRVSDARLVLQTHSDVKKTKLEIQIAAQDWAEFLYKEYVREKDIVNRSKKLGNTATILSNLKSKGEHASSNILVPSINEKSKGK